MEISARWHTLEMSGIKLWINDRVKTMNLNSDLYLIHRIIKDRLKEVVGEE